MYLIPTLNNNNEIIDGTYIKALGFCKKNCKNGKCLDFYVGLSEKPIDAFYRCPYGLSVYITVFDNQRIIFTSFREINTYKPKNHRFDKEKIYNPVLSQEQILVLIKNSISEKKFSKELEERDDAFNSMSHEVKKLNAQIKENCDSLFNIYLDKNEIYSLTPDEYNKMFEKIRSLYCISTMINTRYSLYDYEKKNETLLIGNPININIYKKFDKCRRVLNNYQKKNISITFTGSSYKCIKGYPTSFEMIPFLILENALKYSNSGSKVEVSFLQNDRNLQIEITSISPYCSQEDLKHITEKGFRGKNAKKIADGNGIGLYLFKILCDIHNINVNFNSDSKQISQFNNIPFAPFIVSLNFVEVYDSDNE